MTEIKMAAFSYSDLETPNGYKCGDCGAGKVRLYREYQTFLNHQSLRCRACALINQKKSEPDNSGEHSIGWLVAAVPTVEGDTFWGYSSVPQDGVEWWNRLPR